VKRPILDTILDDTTRQCLTNPRQYAKFGPFATIEVYLVLVFQLRSFVDRYPGVAIAMVPTKVDGKERQGDR
jgi:hypothetical protein